MRPQLSSPGTLERGAGTVYRGTDPPNFKPAPETAAFEPRVSPPKKPETYPMARTTHDPVLTADARSARIADAPIEGAATQTRAAPLERSTASHIAPQLRALVVPIDSVELHPRNPRRGDVAATWIPRVKLDRVDRDNKGAQLGRDVGRIGAVEQGRSGPGGGTFDRRVGDARGTRVCGEDGVVRCSSHGVGLRLLGRRDPWLESCSLRRGFEVGRIGAPVDGPRAALERPGARKLRTHRRGGLVPRRLDPLEQRISCLQD